MDAETLPSLDGRRFAALTDTVGGDVGADTVFDYQEADGVVWAAYSGGAVLRGFLVGTREADTVCFRYTQINRDRETSSGRCVSQLSRSEDGRLRLHETWSWESKSGSGTSLVVEL
ncbi:hypothetical protein [Microbacterium sp. No. 7]|uniref:hypothetical protein n=1 Tax=Microbacterium sp. No. 7 TaxID=1714373 RepID=UPI0006D27AF2|nr:hypothetical protein [Microbacterium sp. No. 7]ALJ20782.1 hypothetical protein AOA12_13075 [Microbacterium sp. No. 7]